MNRKPLLTAAVVLLLTVPACSSGSSTSDSAQKSVIAQSSAEPSVALTDQQLKDMDSDDFAKLSAVERMNYYMPRIDEWRGDTLKIMIKYLTAEEKGLLGAALPANKSDYSDQDILNQYSIDLYDASIQGDAPAEKNEGRKMASIVISPLNSNYDFLSEAVGKEPVYSTYKVKPGETYQGNGILRNTTLRGKKIGSGGARVISAISMRDNSDKALMTFERLTTPSGEEEWAYLAAYDVDDPSIDFEVRTAIQNSK